MKVIRENGAKAETISTSLIALVIGLDNLKSELWNMYIFLVRRCKALQKNQRSFFLCLCSR